MAISAEKVSVGTTATALNDGTPGRIIVSASAAMFIGGSDVDTTDGFPLASTDAPLLVYNDSGEILYGIVATGTADANVLRS